MKYRALWLGLAVAFVVAVGYVLLVLPTAPTAGQGAAGRSTPPAPVPTNHSDGLSDRHDGYRIVPVTLPTRRGRAVAVAFRILGPGGEPPAGYETVGTRPLHLYLVRDDFSGYEHLHPELTGDTWTARVNVPDGGAYRLYAEFTPRGRAGTGHPTVLGLPFVIAGDTRYVPLPAPASRASVDGFTVTRLDGTAHLGAGRAAIVRFQVTDRAGAPVPTLEPYLGAYAHVSAFEVFTQGLTHLHPAVAAGATAAPADATLVFHAQFANRGEQRLFLQFSAGGKVRQVAFTVFVT